MLLVIVPLRGQQLLFQLKYCYSEVVVCLGYYVAVLMHYYEHLVDTHQYC